MNTQHQFSQSYLPGYLFTLSLIYRWFTHTCTATINHYKLSYRWLCLHYYKIQSIAITKDNRGGRSIFAITKDLCYYISIGIAIRHVTVAIYHNILLHYIISIYIITVMTTLCALYMHDHCVLCMVI